MTDITTRWDLSDIEVAESSEQAALNVVRWMTERKLDTEEQWVTVMKLARRSGASLRDIAEIARVSPQTVANLTAED